MRVRRGAPRRRHRGQRAIVRGGAARGGRGGADGRPAAGRGGIGGVQLAPAAGSPRLTVPGDGVLPVQQHRRRRAVRARRAAPRAGDDPRLGRAPRQQHQSGLPREQPGAVRLDPSIAAVPRDRAGLRRRGGRGQGLHGQPAGARGIRGRGLGVARRARRRTARARVRATAGAGLRGIRRASRRSARGLRRDRRGVRGDGACCVWSVRVAGGASRRRVGGRICARGAGTLGGGDASGVFGAGWRRWFGTRSGGGRGADRSRGARSARRVVAAARAAKHSPRLGGLRHGLGWPVSECSRQLGAR